MASINSDIIVAIAAIIVAAVAVLGLSTWRKELTGRAKFEVARKVMLLGYKIRDDFEFVRSPFTGSWESADRPRREEETETPTESNIRNEWFAKNKRLGVLVEDLQKFQESYWEADIVLGDGPGKLISEVLGVYRESYAELAASISTYFDTELHEQRSGTRPRDEELIQKCRRDIYSSSHDEFSTQIDQTTEKLSSELKRYVR